MSELRTLRESKKLTQEEVAVKIGASTATVSRYESGDRTPSPETVVLLAYALGCSPIDIASGIYSKAERTLKGQGRLA